MNSDIQRSLIVAEFDMSELAAQGQPGIPPLVRSFNDDHGLELAVETGHDNRVRIVAMVLAR